MILGSVTGTEPGILLPGGTAVLPLNWDAFTNIVIAFMNTAAFTDFMGVLDGSGHGSAQLNAPALPPGTTDLLMYFAFCLNNPFDFASNPVAIRVIP
jgi:hypothetical protein